MPRSPSVLFSDHRPKRRGRRDGPHQSPVSIATQRTSACGLRRGLAAFPSVGEASRRTPHAILHDIVERDLGIAVAYRASSPISPCDVAPLCTRDRTGSCIKERLLLSTRSRISCQGRKRRRVTLNRMHIIVVVFLARDTEECHFAPNAGRLYPVRCSSCQGTDGTLLEPAPPLHSSH